MRTFKIVGLVILVLAAVCYFLAEDRQEFIKIYMTKGKTPANYRNFVKEVGNFLREAGKKGYHISRSYEVVIAYEEDASLTAEGGLRKASVISLYVEDRGPLDWFETTELADEAVRRSRAKDFAMEILREIFEFHESRLKDMLQIRNKGLDI